MVGDFAAFDMGLAELLGRLDHTVVLNMAVHRLPILVAILVVGCSTQS